MEPQNKIVIYQTDDGKTQIDVKFENETVWLTQSQIAQLFGTKKAAISKHISHIYDSDELDRESTVSKIETVQIEGQRSVKRFLTYYNLDMIISVGYRVNSKNATSFRRWATRVLREYLIQGYAVNSRIEHQNLVQLQQLVGAMSRTIKLGQLTGEQSNALLDVVTDYALALDRLDDYDYQRLTIPNGTTTEQKFHATYEGAMQVLEELRHKFGGSSLFGNEKDDSFKSSIGQIYQTFGGQDLYPSVEEKAAMLLYLVTKNHSFSDGNKRIAATLFLWFMNENGILYHADGSKRIDDSALVAVTLLIAESRPAEKDTMVKVVVNLMA